MDVYEQKFSVRFTEEDEEFQRHVQNGKPEPPVLEDWRSSRNRFQDRGHRGGREWSGPPGWRSGGNQHNSHRQHYHRY